MENTSGAVRANWTLAAATCGESFGGEVRRTRQDRTESSGALTPRALLGPRCAEERRTPQPIIFYGVCVTKQILKKKTQHRQLSILVLIC